MALSNEDKIAIRVMILREINRIFGTSDPKLADRIEDALRNATADEIALTDAEAAERFRLLKPTF